MYQLVLTDQEFEMLKNFVFSDTDDSELYKSLCNTIIDAQDHKNEREYYLRKLMHGNGIHII